MMNSGWSYFGFGLHICEQFVRTRAPTRRIVTCEPSGRNIPATVGVTINERDTMAPCRGKVRLRRRKEHNMKLVPPRRLTFHPPPVG